MTQNSLNTYFDLRKVLIASTKLNLSQKYIKHYFSQMMYATSGEVDMER